MHKNPRYLSVILLLASVLLFVACGEDSKPNDNASDTAKDATSDVQTPDAPDTNRPDTTPQNVCGDNTVAGSEACDDGNTTSGDGCSSTCAVEACGDGAVNNTSETCDDGNTQSGDGCSSSCATEVCGDGSVNNDGAEQCDDGNTTSGDGCSATCVSEVCGDGTVNNDGAEQCDDANTTDGDGCSAACLTETCGDGTVNNSGAEGCDDGNTTDGDGCSATCALEACGDNVINSGEDCDDGNTADGDDCPSTCIFVCGPNDTPCDDGDGCTQTDTCQADVCVGANPINCSALDACHMVGTCDSGTGLCDNPPIPGGSETTLDQFTLTTAGFVDIASTQIPGQLFTVGADGRLLGIEVHIAVCQTAPSGGMVNLNLYDINDTLITSASVSTETLPVFCGGADLSQSVVGPAYFDLLDACVPVLAGQQLYFTLEKAGYPVGVCDTTTTFTCTAGTNIGSFCFSNSECEHRLGAGETTDPYAGGYMIVNGNPQATYDLQFKTFVQP